MWEKKWLCRENVFISCVVLIVYLNHWCLDEANCFYFFITKFAQNISSEASVTEHLCRSSPSPSSPSSVTVHKPGAPEWHGSEHSERRLDLHQPLQQRPRAEQRDRPVALRPAQLHLRCPFPLTGHPIQHRLRRPTHLWRVLPAVQHSKVCHLDGKTRVRSVFVESCIKLAGFHFLFCKRSRINVVQTPLIGLCRWDRFEWIWFIS